MASDVSAIELLSEVLTNIKDQILTLEAEMINTGNSKEVKELYDHLHEILQRTEQGRVALEAISSNKGAASKLESASDTVKKLRKLEDAMKELEKELREVDFDYFRIVAELLADAKEQMVSFTPYAALPHLVALRARLDGVESELRRQVQWSLREIGQLVENEDADAELEETTVDVGNLSQAHLIVEVLGKPFRDDLLERFAQLQLIPYEKTFRPGKKYSDIDSLDKRFAWFRKLLKAVDNAMGEVFPTNWCVSYHLYKEFARRTRGHLTEVLTGIEQSRIDPEAHVAILLKALKFIYTFETELRATWVAASKLSGHEEGEIEYDLKESVGDAFDPFLGPYIMIERKNLEDLMGKLLREEEANPNAGAVTKTIDTFDSSRKMFEYIKASLKRCTMFSSGHAFLSLSKEYRICLQQYADSLKSRCPAATPVTNSKEVVYEVKGAQEVMMCRIVNTAEYCGDVVPQLEAMMKQLIKPHLVEQVNFAPEIDKFMELIAFTIKVVTAGVMARMEGAFRAMRKVNWSNVDFVGDDSPYVKDIRVVLNVAVPRVRDHISQSYFKNFCSRMATAVLERLMATILRLKRVAKTAAGQLLLDLNGVKELMMKLPHIKLPETAASRPAIPPAYLMVVRSQAAKVEVFLKLVCVEENTLEEMFRDLWPDGSEADLAAIKRVRGMDDLINPLNIDDPLYNSMRHELDQGFGGIKSGVVNIGGKIVDNPVGQGLKTGVKVVGKGVKGAATGVVGVVDAIAGGVGGKQAHQQQGDNHSDDGSVVSALTQDFKHAFGGMKAFMSSAFDDGQPKKQQTPSRK